MSDFAPAPRMIVLEVSHPASPPGRIGGFRFLWAMYVNGYRPDRHCQPGLKGRRVAEFNSRSARSGVRVQFDRMDRYPYLYECGVGAGATSRRRVTNLHLPLRYEAGAVAEVTSWNGYLFRTENAVCVAVPPLPRCRNGLPDAQTQCRNFQFAVACFGP
jgi:hypothetical protein